LKEFCGVIGKKKFEKINLDDKDFDEANFSQSNEIGKINFSS